MNLGADIDIRIFVEPQQGTTYEAVLAMALTAENCGFGGYFCSDHYFAQGNRDGLPGPCDAWTTLAALSRETRSIRLGTLVTPVTFRPPAVFGIITAQVDAMSGGRIEVGLGAGWDAIEHSACGIPFPPRAERFERLDEQIRILVGFWNTPQTQRLSFTGRHYQVVDSPALPKPVQPGGPPLIIGGRGRRVARLAAHFADEHNVPFESPQRSCELFRYSSDMCEAENRDPDTLTRSAAVNVCCATSTAELHRRQAIVAAHVGAFREAGTCWGPPASIIDQLAAYADAGVDRIYLQVLDFSDLSQVELIASDVLPVARTLTGPMTRS